jgi:hypothetical protein
MTPILIAFGLVFACFILILVKNLLWPADERNRGRPHKTRDCGCSKHSKTR